MVMVPAVLPHRAATNFTPWHVETATYENTLLHYYTFLPGLPGFRLEPSWLHHPLHDLFSSLCTKCSGPFTLYAPYPFQHGRIGPIAKYASL